MLKISTYVAADVNGYAAVEEGVEPSRHCGVLVLQPINIFQRNVVHLISTQRKTGMICGYFHGARRRHKCSTYLWFNNETQYYSFIQINNGKSEGHITFLFFPALDNGQISLHGDAYFSPSLSAVGGILFGFESDPSSDNLTPVTFKFLQLSVQKNLLCSTQLLS